MNKRDLYGVCVAWGYFVIMAALIVLLAVHIWA